MVINIVVFQALDEVSLNVNQGEIVTLIGANGVGKTTMLMTICGSPRARTGSITFEGQDITMMPTHNIMRAGIAISPEGRRVFPDLTVRSEEHTSELQSRGHLVCRLLLEKKNTQV